MEISAWLSDCPASLLLVVDGAVVGASASALRELDRPLAELAGPGLLESLEPTDRIGLAATLDRLMRDPAPAPATPLVVRRPGQPGTEGATSAMDVLELRPARHGDGVLIDVRDITELRRADRILNSLCTAIFVTDATGSVIWRSASYVEEFRGAADLKVNSLTWLHPDDLPDALNGFASLLADPGRTHVDFYRVRRPYVENAWNTARLTAVNQLDDPLIGGIVVRAENQSEDSIESIGRTATGFHSLAESAPIGIVVTDPTGQSVYCNRLAVEYLGLRGTKRGRADWTARMSPDDRTAIDAIVKAGLEHQTSGSTVVTIEGPDGGTVWVRVDVQPQVNSVGEPFGVIATLLDVTSETVDATVREVDTVFRIGGDEFVVICEGFSDATGLEGLAKRLIAAVGEPVHVDDVTAHVGLSVGIAVATGEATGTTLVARADTALYEAKQSGRNRSAVATEAAVDVEV